VTFVQGLVEGFALAVRDAEDDLLRRASLKEE
jgi:hypothetical protein